MPTKNLRCFVARHFLSQIYALFWRTFCRPKSMVAYQKGQISGMHMSIDFTQEYITHNISNNISHMDISYTHKYITRYHTSIYPTHNIPLLPLVILVPLVSQNITREYILHTRFKKGLLIAQYPFQSEFRKINKF